MKTFALFCLLLLASACIFVVKAEKEYVEVDAAKAAEMTANADEITNDEQEDTEQHEEETESDEVADKEAEKMDDETRQKRGLVVCRRWRVGRHICVRCCKIHCQWRLCYRGRVVYRCIKCGHICATRCHIFRG